MTDIPELWILRGETWAFPYWCKCVDGIVIAEEAAPMLGVQYAAVRSVLEVSGKIAGANKWAVPLAVWVSLAEQAKVNVKPEECVVWNGQRKREELSHPISLTHSFGPDTDAFLLKIANSTKIISFHDLQMVYHAIQREIVDLLVNREKSVDLGCFILHPIPARSNWKSILYTRHPSYKKMTTYKTSIQKEAIFYKSGMADDFIDPRMLAFNWRNGQIYWHIDVEYKKAWFKNVQRHEEEKLKRKGVTGYADSVFDSLKRAIPRAYKIYNQWLSQIGTPAAQLVACDTNGLLGKLKKFTQWSARLPSFSHRNQRGIVFDTLPESPRTKEAMEETDDCLSEMSFIQPKVKNLRHTIAHTTAERLSMLDAGREQDPQQGMLDSGTGGAGGMAGRVSDGSGEDQTKEAL